MFSKPLRILHYIKHLESGGGETLLYNIYKNIDRKKVQFDFLVNTSKKEILDDKVKELGARKIILVKSEPKIIPLKIILCMISLYRLLKGGKYQILHIHCSNGQGLLYAWIAKIAGVPVRITHIHNTSVEGNFIQLKLLFHNLCKLLFMNSPTDYLACSEAAAKWLYSKRINENRTYAILKNGIELDKFKFNDEIRNRIREEYHIVKKKVIINIGRMEKQKNQIFLLEIFKAICNKTDKDEYRLIMIGRGSLEKKIKKYAKNLDLLNKIIFIEYSDCIENFLWASDLFLLPSLEEGLGIVAIEAQAAGLNIIISDTVPHETYVSELVTVLPLSLSAVEWAERLVSLPIKHDRDGCIYLDSIAEKGFDILDTVSQLEEFYVDKGKQLCIL